MYSFLKRTLKSIIPARRLYQAEDRLRALYAGLYSGNTYQCNICKKQLRTFIHSDAQELCPRCGSIRRSRRLWQLLDNEFLKENQAILDFSPSRSIYRTLKQKPVHYVSSDLSEDFIADYAYDICAIPCADAAFDLIICYHILEHIDDDHQAMQELYRVLKPGGVCLIQTPFKEGEIYEDSSITLPADREKHFGQWDHVRIYSVDGLKSRLELSGFSVEVRQFDEVADKRYGFSPVETVLICRK
jgi:SAM-dependent methyltransferase